METKNIINEAVIGKYCIIRGKEFGAFAGTVEVVENDRVLLKDARRLWYWDGAASLPQLVMEGVKAPRDCKFTVPVESIVLIGVIEIIPATEAAKLVIGGVKEWKR